MRSEHCHSKPLDITEQHHVGHIPATEEQGAQLPELPLIYKKQEWLGDQVCGIYLNLVSTTDLVREIRILQEQFIQRLQLMEERE